MSVIVDPFNANYAIVDGKGAVAVRLIPPPANPSAPTVAEVSGGKIIGYTTDAPFGPESER